MPAKIIRFLLTLSSVAPIGLVLVAGLLWAGQLTWYLAIMIGAPVLLLSALTLLLIAWVPTRIPVSVLAVAEVKSADRDVLAFLLAYALPVLAVRNAQDLSSFNAGAALALVALFIIVIYRLNLMHVNPLLGLVGFHFYEVKAKSGRTYLYVGKSLGSDGDELRVRMLSPDVCLEAGDE